MCKSYMNIFNDSTVEKFTEVSEDFLALMLGPNFQELAEQTEENE